MLSCLYTLVVLLFVRAIEEGRSFRLASHRARIDVQREVADHHACPCSPKSACFADDPCRLREHTFDVGCATAVLRPALRQQSGTWARCVGAVAVLSAGQFARWLSRPTSASPQGGGVAGSTRQSRLLRAHDSLWRLPLLAGRFPSPLIGILRRPLDAQGSRSLWIMRGVLRWRASCSSMWQSASTIAGT